MSNERATGMPCPRCGTGLVMSDRAGVEIDYCPKCRGVWLDSGELDRIIERSAQYSAAQVSSAGQPAGGWIQPSAQDPRGQPQPRGWSKHGNSHGGGHGRSDGHGGKYRKSWIQRLFD